MACKGVFECSQSSYRLTLSHRFKRVFYQLEALRLCSSDVRRTLEEMPKSLEETYERILKKIDQANREDVYRLLQCLAVAVRPLQIEELAAVLAFDFSKGGLPKVKADWRWEDQGEAALSACSKLVSVISNNGTRVVQFSHSSVKEFLMSDHLASSIEEISRFHVLIEPAHATLAQACLGALLCLNEHTDEKSVKQIPLSQYAGQYWVRHARFGDVESQIVDAMDCFLDADNPHFTAWVRIQFLQDLLKNFTGDSDDSERMKAIPHPAAPLYFAVDRGFRGLVERLVVKYPQQVNAWGGECGTPLHASALRGRIDVAQLLVAHGADINSRSSFQGTPLYIAVKEGNLKLARRLLDAARSDVDSHSSCEQTSPHASPKEKGLDPEFADYLLDKVNPRSLYERTPLHTASEEGNLELAEWLLESGADVNVHDMKQNTPLHLAATRGRLDLVRMLLKHGAEVQARGIHRYTPLFSAAEGGNPDVVHLLLDHGADARIRDKNENNALHIAAFHGHLEVARVLLALNLDVNTQNDSGMNPLYCALDPSRKPNVDVVRLLLDYGAEVHMPEHDRCYRSALHLAAGSGNPEIVQMILDRNPELEARGGEGETPLLTASSDGNPAVVQLLLDHGADPHACDDDGSTALDYAGTLGVSRMLIKLNVSQTCAFLCAANHGDPEQMQLLLDYGASPDVRGDYEETPLHSAAHWGRLAAVRFLVLEAKVDVNARDRDGTTPLHLASQGLLEANPKLVEFLLDHGADVKARLYDDSENGATAYDFASQDEIRELLSKYAAAAA
jgi:ankyrin repeat protein